jgi:hypothetical protein
LAEPPFRPPLVPDTHLLARYPAYPRLIPGERLIPGKKFQDSKINGNSDFFPFFRIKKLVFFEEIWLNEVLLKTSFITFVLNVQLKFKK